MKRVRVKMKIPRLRLQSTVLKKACTSRPKLYLDLRGYWLHELRQLRAQRRIAGKNTKPQMKIAQKELARLRQEY